MGPASAVMERNQYKGWLRVGVKAVGRPAELRFIFAAGDALDEELQEPTMKTIQVQGVHANEPVPTP